MNFIPVWYNKCYVNQGNNFEEIITYKLTI